MAELSGFRLMPGEEMNAAFTMVGNQSKDGITALAGGGYNPNTTPMLATGFNRVNTVVTSGDSVALPSAVQGSELLVVNSGASTLNVFPASTDTINALAAGANATQATGVSALYFCPTTGKWYRMLSA